MVTFRTKCSQENMCDSCDWGIAECTQVNLIYGDGIGEDNIIECDQYSGSEYQEEDEYQPNAGEGSLS